MRFEVTERTWLFIFQLFLSVDTVFSISVYQISLVNVKKQFGIIGLLGTNLEWQWISSHMCQEKQKGFFQICFVPLCRKNPISYF